MWRAPCQGGSAGEGCLPRRIVEKILVADHERPVRTEFPAGVGRPPRSRGFGSELANRDLVLDGVVTGTLNFQRQSP